jgi:hypothetical protein
MYSLLFFKSLYDFLLAVGDKVNTFFLSSTVQINNFIGCRQLNEIDTLDSFRGQKFSQCTLNRLLNNSNAPIHREKIKKVCRELCCIVSKRNFILYIPSIHRVFFENKLILLVF